MRSLNQPLPRVAAVLIVLAALLVLSVPVAACLTSVSTWVDIETMEGGQPSAPARVCVGDAAATITLAPITGRDREWLDWYNGEELDHSEWAQPPHYVDDCPAIWWEVPSGTSEPTYVTTVSGQRSYSWAVPSTPGVYQLTLHIADDPVEPQCSDGISDVQEGGGTELVYTVTIAVSKCPGTIIYVNHIRSDDTGDGFNWITAKKTVQAGMDIAGYGDEVWVAQGTYTRSGTRSFVVTPGVGLYGGFVGGTNGESNRSERDWNANVTTLDGTGGDVVVAIPDNATSDTVLDGFTIRNGNGEFYGGGIYCGGGAVIAHNKITGNTSDDNACAIDCRGPATIHDNVIVDNVGHGNAVTSGISCTADAKIVNNMFVNNAISASSCSAMIKNNIFANLGSGAPTLSVCSTCSFDHNDVYNYGLPSGFTNNITDAPQFVDASQGDYHISDDSPCKNAGYNAALGVDWRDMAGNERVMPFGGSADIGAYELVCLPLSAPTVTSPSGTTGELAPTVSWTVAAVYSRYRVQVLNDDDSVEWDSNTLRGSATSSQITHLLGNNTHYRVKVQVGNACEWGDWSEPVAFTVAFTEPPLPTTVPYCQ